MTIHELLRDANDPSIPASVLLRRAIVIAHKADDQEFKKWLDWELDGYSGPSESIPKYRRPKGRICGRDEFGRVWPLAFRPQESELEELMSAPPVGLPITQIEAAIKASASSGTIETSLDPLTLQTMHNYRGDDDGFMQYVVGDFQHILEGARTRLVSFLVALPTPDAGTERPLPNRSPIAWFQALNVVWQLIIGLATIVGAVAAVLALGPCKHTSVKPSAPRDSVAGARRIESKIKTPWNRPPYAALKFKGLRSHPVEFTLYGDSVIVDVVMEQGDSTSQQWATDRPTTPLIKFEVHSKSLHWHPGVSDEWTQVGQWVVGEKDRAVFVVPKARIMGKNLRVCPNVSVGRATRYPLVQGKWIRKGDGRCWSFWLRIDKAGAIQKSGWVNSDDNPSDGV